MFELGIESGGTKVNVVRFPHGAAGDFETLRIPKPGNLKSIGAERLAKLVCEIRDLSEIPDAGAVRVAAGISGMDTESDRLEVEQCFLQAGFNRENLRLLNDAEFMLKAIGGDGLLLVAGTGSNCFGRFSGRLGHAGGHGYRIGDEGSGFYIGRRAINEVQLIDELQKLGETSLTLALKQHLKIDSLKLIDDLIYPDDGMVPKDLIASLAPVVFDHAAEGDRIAREIIAEAGQGIERMILGVMRQLDIGESIVGIRGGIFRNQHCQPLLLEPLKDRLAEQRFAVNFLNLEYPIDGVDPAVLAFRRVLA